MSELIVKYNIGFKALLQQGISEPIFYDELVYKFKRIVGISWCHNNKWHTQLIGISASGDGDKVGVSSQHLRLKKLLNFRFRMALYFQPTIVNCWKMPIYFFLKSLYLCI